ncbi:adhesion G protein-coupled receptor F5-like isoform X4 [Triplophysa rosa]|uniref:adhesion G protein-coupled receptor F5-like isoform X4 n=1 Tax=Triplophysa rosa TaxID=992332 RepID=UPI00254639A9|nr:adhesion G protein-coupled receptor F5-like isoform X4 [Triplophysa rosa]
MAGQILRHILVLTVAVLLAHVCEAEANFSPETTKALQFSYMYSDEPVHHIRQRRADSYTDYTVEIEINASSISVIDEIKKELEKIQIASPVANLTLLEANFTTVCSFFDTEYQCRCEAQHFWPCDMCKLYRSCNTSNDACSCIDNKPSGQFCQKTTNPACTQPPTDINECLNSSLVCGPNAYCHNSNGSYWCSCWSGYNATVPNLTISINNTCTDINECLNSSLVCGPNTYCHNSNGSFSCSCWSGYNVTKMNESVSSSNPCTDVNECQGNPSVCGPNSNCTNVNGGYNCSCWDGFTATVPNLTISINNTCTDINECLNSSLVCGPNAYCHNSNGSYWCSCWSGYNATVPNLTISINNTCTDINECLNSSLVCGPNTYCHNSNGSFSCSCWSGYNVTKMNESVSSSNPCTDVNECQGNPSVCGPNSNCTNVNGGYNCSCWDGFTATVPNLTISINNTCTDINECLNSSLVCGPNAYCHNSNGSYWCSCWSGYNATVPNLTISINNTCTDINECLNSSLVCGPNTYCHNSNGSFSCSCWSGYNVTKMNESVSSSNPCTVYSTVTPPQTVSSTVTTPQTAIKMSMTIDKPFDTSLTKPEDSHYKDFAKQIQDAVEQSYKSLPSYKTGSVNVTGFRPGSTIADYTIIATNSNLDFTSANINLYNILLSKGITVAANGFAQTEQKPLISTSGNLYPQQKLELKCPQSVNRTITWKVNEKDPDSTKYTISEDGGTLTLNSAAYSDHGRYSCIMQTASIPYIQWQDISIEQEPSISVGDNERVFPCDGRTVQLTCYVNADYSVEWVLNVNVQTSEIGSDSITVKYIVPKDNCSKEILTCRLKGLPQLLDYSYSTRSVTVKTSTEDFTCQDNTLGFGKTNDMTKGLCENGKEGSITYKCKSNGWAIEQDDCVLKVIKDLESKLQGLAVTAIPQFMAELSNAVEQNNASVTQSAATVKTIVEILSNIADLSKNITHKKPVMESFLNTVDIIVSDNSSKTWNDLNNKNTTGNTSVKLLEAIENISDRLSDVFAINLSSIHLNRVTIKNSFNQTSQLPSSTTQIVIPNISKPTFITVIFFSKLNDVLPTRNTPNNDNRTSQNRINGDVVVVKVNETINNISFGFDITNSSLGNPQCVFWNFDLDRWDSTGCKVKITGNETDKVTCECIHTTSFSFLMSPFAITDPVKRTALAYITYIGVAISMASLVLCLIIEIILWKSVTRNDTSYMRHVSIVNIAVSLLIANFCFIIGAAIADQDIKQEQMISVGRCSAVVFFMHFFYLAFFFWMLVSALLLFYSTVIVFGQMSRTEMMVIAFTVGYGAPLLIAVITVAFTAGPKNYVSKENACWLNWNPSRALLAFVIPALTIVFINLVVLIVVVCKILKRGVGAVTRPGERHILIVIARCVAFLTPIFGLTWGFGIGTMVSRDFSLHVVFALLNSLQGVFVLVFGILLDGKVRETLAGKLSLSSLGSSPTRSTNAGMSSSSGLGIFARLRRNVYNISNPSAARSANSTGASETLMNP